jgi:cysteine desulfurase / selenocysteine lyase
MDYTMLTMRFRSLVEGVETRIPLEDGSTVQYTNFDNAATTPPFKMVLQEIMKFAPWYSSVHRGTGYKSKLTSDFYENSRKEVLNFVSADSDEQIAIYVKNTSEAINKLSNRLERKNNKDIILSTEMEHHSNDLPWRGKFQVHYIEVDKSGKLSMEDLKNKLQIFGNRIALVTVTGASNVTGYINDIYEIAELTHKFGSKVLVDGAQLVPHVPVNMGKAGELRHIDYLAFSAHKMYAPFGTGVLIGPKETFKEGNPDYMGGGTVDKVTHEMVTWAEPPEKEEAGSPNVMGVVALLAAIRMLNSIGMFNIQNYEDGLMVYALEKLNTIPDVILYGSTQNEGRVGIIPFNIRGMDDEITANILSSEAGIAVRNGCFCAQPYMRKLLGLPKDADKGGMVRVSFGLYNSLSEIDTLFSVLNHIIKNKSYYNEKYKHLLY